MVILYTIFKIKYLDCRIIDGCDKISHKIALINIRKRSLIIFWLLRVISFIVQYNFSIYFLESLYNNFFLYISIIISHLFLCITIFFFFILYLVSIYLWANQQEQLKIHFSNTIQLFQIKFLNSLFFLYPAFLYILHFIIFYSYFFFFICFHHWLLDEISSHIS